MSISFLLPLLILGLSPLPLYADAPCDGGLRPEHNPAIGYRERGEGRCEGFYVSRVSAGKLRLVGLSYGELRFDPAKDTSLVLGSPVSRGVVQVRAVAIPEKTYYRLDALIDPAKGAGKGGTFDWSLDVVRNGGLRAQDIGLYGFLAEQPQTYVPLRLPGGGEGLRLAVQAGRALAKALWRYAPAPDGRCGGMPKWETTALPAGIHDRSPLVIDLPARARGRICLEVAALPTSGSWLQGRWTIETGR